MSLSVYLTGKTKRVQCVCTQCGHNRRLTGHWQITDRGVYQQLRQATAGA